MSRSSPDRRFGSFSLEDEGRQLRFRTQPGVFSQDGLDKGTQLLVETARSVLKPHMTVLDLGSGVGVLGIWASIHVPRGEVWMVDSDVRAARLAEENVRSNGIDNAHVVLGDITLDLPEKLRFDLVLSNPPTHSGKEVLSSFVEESYAVLRPGGRILFVVNRLLSVREKIEAVFDNVEVAERRHGFIVLGAEKIRRRSGEQ